MNNLLITKIDETHYQVSIHHNTPTKHIVKVTPEYAQKLTGGKFSTEQLLEKSFEFLLAREPNTSILRSFELSVISHYFPEYEREIGRML
jgi:hypothetical protein